MWKLFLPWFLFLSPLLLLLLLQLLQKLLLLIFLQKPLLILLFLSFHCPLFFFHVGLLLAHRPFDTSNPDLLELLCDFPQDRVDAYIRPFVERLLTHRTLVQRAGFPVSQDAALAEVVSAGDGHGVGEDVETDGAVHLLFRKVPSSGHSCTAERQGHFQRKLPGSERGIKPAVMRLRGLDGLTLFGVIFVQIYKAKHDRTHLLLEIRLDYVDSKFYTIRLSPFFWNK